MAQGTEIRVRGQVQGVGFRPFVWSLAQRFSLRGVVSNDAQGVIIRVVGGPPQPFLDALQSETPPLAAIHSVAWEAIEFNPPTGFEIAPSGPAGSETGVTPDAAMCDACRAECEGEGRRKGYAFTNCTNCGPRFSILHALPYDRAQTTMSPFHMCADCRAEYEDPADRRFHAQPIACPACGPTLIAVPDAEDPLAETARRLAAGQIVAIKGLGGVHLACDATDSDAIARLRARKKRPTKPLAVMAPLDTIRRYAEPTAEEEAVLRSAAAPIVLLPQRGARLPGGIAPGTDHIGWMIPYTPLHHLLLAQVGRPLVMTSGNLSGEPQVIGNDEAREKLGEIADAFLLHNRDIARRLDDSVMRMGPAGPVVLRRARGLAPGTMGVPEGFEDAASVVAYGAHLKSAICLLKGGRLLLSHHLGDLDDVLTWEEFQKADRDYADLFAHAPTAVACDLHPDYRSSRHAAAKGLPVIQVQHHHAHLASCLGEAGWPLDGGKVAGIILDGLGLGEDGTVWGGELLLGDYRGFERVGSLTPVPLPGGDAAGREPWRNLLAQFDHAGLQEVADRLMPDQPRDLMRQAVATGTNAPLSSSAGRLFDAMAAAVGCAPLRQSFEGEAALRLEAMARAGGAAGAYSFGPALETAPLWAEVARDLTAGVAPGVMAARFHAGLAQAFALQARALIDAGRAEAVALSGGCFQNTLLLELCLTALEGVPVLTHGQVPPNDGGLALGQVLIASAKLETA